MCTHTHSHTPANNVIVGGGFSPRVRIWRKPSIISISSEHCTVKAGPFMGQDVKIERLERKYSAITIDDNLCVEKFLIIYRL